MLLTHNFAIESKVQKFRIQSLEKKIRAITTHLIEGVLTTARTRLQSLYRFSLMRGGYLKKRRF